MRHKRLLNNTNDEYAAKMLGQLPGQENPKPQRKERIMPNTTSKEDDLLKAVKAFESMRLEIYRKMKSDELDVGVAFELSEKCRSELLSFITQYTDRAVQTRGFVSHGGSPMYTEAEYLEYGNKRELEGRIDELKTLPFDWESCYDNTLHRHYSKVYEDTYNNRLAELKSRQQDIK